MSLSRYMGAVNWFCKQTFIYHKNDHIIKMDFGGKMGKESVGVDTYLRWYLSTVTRLRHKLLMTVIPLVHSA